MVTVEDLQGSVLTTTVPSVGEPLKVGRIEAVVDGVRVAAEVPPSMIGDEPACKSHLIRVAAQLGDANRAS